MIMSQGPLCECTSCGSEIRSSYKGEFVQCSCGKSFVDWNGYYVKCGGTIVIMEDTVKRQENF